ncbi:MAG TPA: zf-HC2 domain-containing protein [Blastocatellia bacterium]
MRCHRAQKLVPLYCGGELSERAIRAIEAHAEKCPRCSAVLTEFFSVREWLYSYDSPEPSDEFFSEIRNNVHRKIRATASEGALSWQSFLTVSWKSAVGATATLLVVLTLVTILRHRPLSQPNLASARKSDPNTESASTSTLASPANAAPTEEVERPYRWRSRSRHNYPSTRAARSRSLPDERQPETIAPTGIGEYLGQTPESRITIEFQTEDPHIRIIWVTPRYGAEPTGSPDESFKDESEEETGENR